MPEGKPTGTIDNRDPLPRAPLARFGPTTAVHVVEHVEETVAGAAGAGLREPFRGRKGDNARHGGSTVASVAGVHDVAARCWLLRD